MPDLVGPVLVTGGAGFIGSHVTRALAERCEVRIVDTQPLGQQARFVLGPHAERIAATAIEASLADQEAVESAVAQSSPQQIVHVGGIGNPLAIARDPRLALDVNVRGTLSLLAAASTANVDRVILCSSIGVLPAARYEPVDADHPVLTATEGPATGFYGASKLALEAFGIAYADAFGLDVRVLRPSAVYGFGMNFPLHVKPIVEGVVRGEPVLIPAGGGLARDHTHVADVVDMVLALIRAESPVDRIFNAATGRPLEDAFAVAAAVRRLVPSADITVQGGLSDDDRLQSTRRGRLSVAAAEEQLGWTPRYADLEGGLAEYIETLTRFGTPGTS